MDLVEQTTFLMGHDIFLYSPSPFPFSQALQASKGRRQSGHGRSPQIDLEIPREARIMSPTSN